LPQPLIRQEGSFFLIVGVEHQSANKSLSDLVWRSILLRRSRSICRQSYAVGNKFYFQGHSVPLFYEGTEATIFLPHEKDGRWPGVAWLFDNLRPLNVLKHLSHFCLFLYGKPSQGLSNLSGLFRIDAVVHPISLSVAICVRRKYIFVLVS
jgi:hypothetical protein